jgi:hypothetical protein
MSAVDSTVVFLARPTTLVGAWDFMTVPLDVSRFGSVQLQVWRSPMTDPNAKCRVFFEESLDCESWVLGPSTSALLPGYDPADPATGGDPTFASPQFFSYAFRLRWFRLRVRTEGSAPIVTCFAEGLLRDGGGGGAWNVPSAARAAVAPSSFPNVPTIGAADGPTDEGREAGQKYGPEYKDPLEKENLPHSKFG